MKEAFKFCPRCGQPTNFKDTHIHCKACGLDTYLNPKPVVEVALQNEKSEYLFAVRSMEPRRGYLDFPGGFVDANETFEDAARRELKEELGIDINEFEYLGSSHDEYPFQNVIYKMVGVSFYAKIPDGIKVKPADDVADFVFYKLADAPRSRLGWPLSISLTLDKLAEREIRTN